MVPQSLDKSFALPVDKAILKILRLDERRWCCESISVDLGDIPILSDDHPDDPLFSTSTDLLRSIDRGSVRIFISMRSGLRHLCPHCNALSSIKGYSSHCYKTSSFSGMRSEVCIRVPQLFCPHCRRYPTARCPLVVFNHTYTKLLKLDTLSLLSEETVSAASSGCGIGKDTVFDILDNAVEEGLENQDLSKVHTLFIDEIQSTHGHNYITMVADQDHRMIAGVEGHDIGSVRKVCEWLESKGGDPKNITYVSADMSVAYKSGVTECFPKAKIIIDHFHLTKSVNEALDYVRKRTNRELKKKELEYPKNVKYTVLHREANQSEVHKERMEQIRMLNPDLALAFDLKEEFCRIFDKPDKKAARSAFFSWYNHVRGSHIPEMIDVSRRLMKRLNDILRWFSHRISNGVAEGLNNSYKKIKSAAYGYRKVENLINMCLFRKGQLKVSI